MRRTAGRGSLWRREALPSCLSAVAPLIGGPLCRRIAPPSCLIGSPIRDSSVLMLPAIAEDAVSPLGIRVTQCGAVTLSAKRRRRDCRLTVVCCPSDGKAVSSCLLDAASDSCWPRAVVVSAARCLAGLPSSLPSSGLPCCAVFLPTYTPAVSSFNIPAARCFAGLTPSLSFCCRPLGSSVGLPDPQLCRRCSSSAAQCLASWTPPACWHCCSLLGVSLAGPPVLALTCFPSVVTQFSLSISV